MAQWALDGDEDGDAIAFALSNPIVSTIPAVVKVLEKAILGPRKRKITAERHEQLSSGMGSMNMAREDRKKAAAHKDATGGSSGGAEGVEKEEEFDDKDGNEEGMEEQQVPSAPLSTRVATTNTTNTTEKVSLRSSRAAAATAANSASFDSLATTMNNTLLNGQSVAKKSKKSGRKK